MRLRNYYFAYGQHLSEYLATTSFPSARFFKFALVKDYRLCFSPLGLCGIVKSKEGDYVEGILYSIDANEIPEPFEGSIKLSLPVLTDEGRWVDAITFVNKESEKSATPEQELLDLLFKKYHDYGFNRKNLESALEP